MKLQRIRCCVPGCKKEKATRSGVSDWICEPHWKTVPYQLRNRVEKARKSLRRASGSGDLIHYSGAASEMRLSWNAAIMEAKLKAASVAGKR